VVPLDTDPAAHEAQVQVYRRMGPASRVALAARMSDDMRGLALQGIRTRHPDYDDQQARHALFRLLLGDDLTRAIWPGQPLVAP